MYINFLIAPMINKNLTVHVQVNKNTLSLKYSKICANSHLGLAINHVGSPDVNDQIKTLLKIHVHCISIWSIQNWIKK
jgi:hypothetical protein